VVFEKIWRGTTNKQLLPTPDQERPFFANIIDPTLPYYVSSGSSSVQWKRHRPGHQEYRKAPRPFWPGLIHDNRLAVIVGTTAGNTSHRPDDHDAL